RDGADENGEDPARNSHGSSSARGRRGCDRVHAIASEAGWTVAWGACVSKSAAGGRMDPSEEPQDFPLEPPKKDWPRARGKESVIVAEDSEALRDLMLAMLSGLGYEVLTAA